MTQYQTTGSRPVPPGGFDRFAWFFMRLSGVALLLLALGHLSVMHLLNSVDSIDYAFVAARYATPFWRTYDGLLLILALLHGFNGFRVVTDDYLKGYKRLVVQSLAGLACLALLLVGLYIVFTFQPEIAPALSAGDPGFLP